MLNFTVSSFGQKAERLNWAAHSSLNQSFLSGIDGIRDTRGYVKDQTRLGYGLGATLKFRINDRYSTSLNMNLFNIEKVSYYYYGSHKSSRSSKPQIGINFEYALSNKRLVFLGYLASAELFEGTVKFYFISNDPLLTPSYDTYADRFSSLNSLLSIGTGKTVITDKGRRLEHVLSLYLGFKDVAKYRLVRFNPDITSNFSYRGTNLNYTLRWYFKRVKT